MVEAKSSEKQKQENKAPDKKSHEAELSKAYLKGRTDKPVAVATSTYTKQFVAFHHRINETKKSESRHQPLTQRRLHLAEQQKLDRFRKSHNEEMKKISFFENQKRLAIQERLSTATSSQTRMKRK